MIQLIDVSKEYRSADSPTVCALKNINLELPDRGMVFILGKSGSGKSTLLNVIGGLDTYEGGHLIINGVSTKDFKAKDFDDYRNACAGFVFQEFHLLENYTVGKNVSLPLELQCQGNKESLVAQALEQVELKGYENRRANALSGGQKQRVAIARALVKNPQIILADEPSGNLDSETGEQIFSLLKKLSAERLVVAVTHDRDSALRYGDRVIEISDGTITKDSVFFETPTAMPVMREHKKSVLPFKNILGLGVSNLKYRKIRLTLTTILFSLTLTCFLAGMTLVFYEWDKAALNAYQRIGEDTIILTQQALPTTNINYDTTIMPWSNKEKIEERNKDFDFIPLYSRGNVQWMNLEELETYNSRFYYYNGKIKYAALSEQDYDEYGIKIAAGRMPENAFEIVLPIFLYDCFEAFGYKGQEINSYTDMLDKKLFLPDLKRTLKIVGIADTGLDTKYEDLKNVDEARLTSYDAEIFSLLENDLYNEVNLSFHSALLVNAQFEELHLNGCFDCYHNVKYQTTDIGYFFGGEESGGLFKDSYADFYGQSLNFGSSSGYNFTRLLGEGALKDDEVIIPLSFAEQYTKRFMPLVLDGVTPSQKTPTLEEIQNKILAGITLEIGSKKSEEGSFSARKDYSVVGYYVVPNADPFSSIEYILLADSVLLDVGEGNNRVISMVTKLTGDEQKDLSLLAFAFDQEVDDLVYFGLTGKNGMDVIDAYASSSVLIEFGLYLSLALGIFSIFMMLNFISYSISNKKKDIGILRAMGTKNRDIFLIFFCEGAAIALIAFVVACILGYIGMWAANTLLAKNGIIIHMFEFDIKAALITVALAAFIAAASCFVPLLRILRKKPVEIIRSPQ